MCIAAASYTLNVLVCVRESMLFFLVSHLVRFKSLPQSVEWTCEPYTDYSFWRVMKKRRIEQHWRILVILENWVEIEAGVWARASEWASDRMGSQRRRRRANSEKNVKKAHPSNFRFPAISGECAPSNHSSTSPSSFETNWKRFDSVFLRWCLWQ